MNAVGSENRTQAEVKKKWSDIKVDVKRRLALEKRGPPCLNSESARLWVTLLSQGWWEHVWVTPTIPKVNTYVFV